MTDDFNRAEVICPSCGHTNPTGGHFCRNCQAPLTSHAVTDPVLSILARGFVLRQAVDKPRRFIVVLGTWLIAGPMLLGSVWFLFEFFEILFQYGGRVDLFFVIAVGMTLLFTLISAAILYRTTMAYFCGRQTTQTPTDPSDPDKSPHTMSDDSTATTCLSCREPMTEESTVCTKCGWTFADSVE